MRLLCAKTQKLVEFFGDAIPPYAILSHTWEDEEITFQDITQGHSYRESKKGWAKVIKCCQQAIKDDFEFVWIDTCCIDKSSSAELQEAINSMFKWYEMSLECYVYISDFSHPGLNAEPQEIKKALRTYARSRWFTRGWTLQELLAPQSVRFFDSTWLEFGDKVSLRKQIAAVTGISQKVLVDSVIDARRAMDFISIAQRMSWASNRTTTREEDIAYCLLGIFDVNMPLLYGEGHKAFQRLQEEIIKKSDDQSILAWGFCRDDRFLWRVSTALAQSPLDFLCCGEMVSRGAEAPGDGFSMSQRGLRLDLPVYGDFNDGDILYCVLNCTLAAKGRKGVTTRRLAVPLARCTSRADGAKPKVDEYYRLCNRIPHWVDENEIAASKRMTIYIASFHRHGDLVRPRLNCRLAFESPPPDYFIAGMFPPERSLNSLLHLTLYNQTGTSFLIVHIASNLQLPGYLVVIKCRLNSREDDPVTPDSLSQEDSLSDSLNSLSNSLDSICDSLDSNEHVPLPLKSSDVRENIIESFAVQLGLDKSKINSATTLRELNFDSLSAVAIHYEIEERLDIDFDEDILFHSKTIKDVENKFRFAMRSHSRNSPMLRKGQIKSPLMLQKGQIPLGEIDSPQFAIVEVAPDASLVKLLEKADLLDTAQYTNNTNDTSEAVLQLSEDLSLTAEFESYHTQHSLTLEFIRHCF
ncbi:heterokaryon incompatibility protein-domain-containing protein [Trichoderma sp. SZMC 28011]